MKLKNKFVKNKYLQINIKMYFPGLNTINFVGQVQVSLGCFSYLNVGHLY